jgi:hypothetical protein
MLGWTEIGGNLMIITVVALIVVLKAFTALLRHKERIAAIEKGIPLQDLARTMGITTNLKIDGPRTNARYISLFALGVMAFLIGVCALVYNHYSGSHIVPEQDCYVFVTFAAVGIAFMIWGGLLWKFAAPTQIQQNAGDEIKS